MRKSSATQLKKIADLIQNTPSQSAIILTDEANRVILWNHGAVKLLGYQSEEFLGQECLIDYRPVVHKTRNPDDLKYSEADTDFYAYRTNLITKDGRRHSVHISASRLRDVLGKTQGYLFVIENITEEVIQEKLRLILVSIAQISSKKQPLLKMLESCMRAIQSHLELPLVYLCLNNRNGFHSRSWSGIQKDPLSLHCSAQSSDEGGMSVKCSECCALRHITCEEISAHHVSEYLGDKNNFNEPLDIFHAPLTSDNAIIGILHFVIPESMKKVYAEEGQILDLIANKVASAILTRQLEEDLQAYADNLERIVKDRTQQLREKDAQVIQSAKLATLGEMATGVAHEINQPLGGISLITQGLIKALQKGKLTEAILEDRLHAMNEQIERINKIITHLRIFGRQAPEAKTRVQINDLVMEVFDFFGQQLKKRNINLDVDLDESLPAVLADNNRIEQVLLNIITNARDALEEQEKRVQSLLSSRNPPKWAADWEKKLFIRTYLNSGRVIIAIGDTGGGIPEEIRDKIFEPFFTTKEVGKGTGLGLSISYGIIKEFGGDIRLVTEVDLGSTFFVRLPVMEA